MYRTVFWALGWGGGLFWKMPLKHGGALKAEVHVVAKSWTWLSDFTFTFHFHTLENEMATHSSILAWGIPGTGEPGGLPSTGSHRVGHDWSDLAAAAGAAISYKKRIASPGLMQDTVSLGLVHWDDPEGWYGEEGGRGFRMRNTCTPMADASWCMAKPIQ